MPFGKRVLGLSQNLYITMFRGMDITISGGNLPNHLTINDLKLVKLRFWVAKNTKNMADER